VRPGRSLADLAKVYLFWQRRLTRTILFFIINSATNPHGVTRIEAALHAASRCLVPLPVSRFRMPFRSLSSESDSHRRMSTLLPLVNAWLCQLGDVYLSAHGGLLGTN
jgi:hypothetical protein